MQVVMHVEWGTDWHTDHISFSYGDKDDLPDSISSIKQLPKSAISHRINSKLALDDGITLGMTSQEIIRKLGTPKSDTTANGMRCISYETDYKHTEDVCSMKLPSNSKMTTL